MDEVWLIDPSNGGEHGRMCGKVREEERRAGGGLGSPRISAQGSLLSPGQWYLTHPPRGRAASEGPSTPFPPPLLCSSQRHSGSFSLSWAISTLSKRPGRRQVGGGGAGGIKGSQSPGVGLFPGDQEPFI